MTHAAAAFGSLQGCRADAGLPAHLGPAGPQLMTERAKLGLVFENRYWHENDHAQAGGISVMPGRCGLALSSFAVVVRSGVGGFAPVRLTGDSTC